MIKVGVIGCGKIAQVRHIPEYELNPNAKIEAFYDLNIERAEELAKKYQSKAYETLNELLADSNIDAVSICVANNSHASTTIQALKAGKHVLCEKPMAMNIEDCEEMISVADKYGKSLMIAQNQRLNPAHKKAKEMIAKGEMGKVVTFRTTFGHAGPETWSIDSSKGVWFFEKKTAVMGAMADLGIHKTDLIQYLLGEKIVEVTAKVVTLNKEYADGTPIGVDDNAICIYQMESGTIGTMTASWTYYGREDNSTIIYGTKGILKIYDNPVHSLVFIGTDGKEVYYDTDQIQTNDNQTNSGVINEFISCLEERRNSDISGESVLSAMKAVFASLESSDKGIGIKITQ